MTLPVLIRLFKSYHSLKEQKQITEQTCSHPRLAQYWGPFSSPAEHKKPPEQVPRVWDVTHGLSGAHEPPDKHSSALRAQGGHRAREGRGGRERARTARGTGGTELPATGGTRGDVRGSSEELPATGGHAGQQRGAEACRKSKVRPTGN